MNNWEADYLNIMRKLLNFGDKRKTRNATVNSLFAQQLTVDLRDGTFPLLSTRKMFYRGIFAEYAAFLRGPKHVNHFESLGCNYWGMWADEDGHLELDYGRDWKNQFGHVIDCLRNDPTDRRMLVNTWNSERLAELSLPCCHYSYQFYHNNGSVDLLWNQRSADWAIGVPSDIVLAAIMLISLCAETEKRPGRIIMQFGDTHLYSQHVEGAIQQIGREPTAKPYYEYEHREFFDFLPGDIEILNYEPQGRIKYELIG